MLRCPRGRNVEMMRRLWVRLKGANPLVVDSILAGLLTIAGILSLSARPSSVHPTPSDVWAYLLVLLGFGALALRRRYPITVLAVVTATASVYVLRDYVENGLPVIALIALYTVASLAPRRQWGAAVAAISVLLLALTLVRGENLSAADLAGNVAIFAIAAVFGDSVRTRRAYTSQLELRAIDLEANQEAQAQRAVAEERLRIARELHDVVAHAMSVVAVQSGVGAHVIDTDPAEAKRILENVKTSSRTALNEMRRLLGVLRDEGDGPVSRTPAAGLEGVDELADGLRQAGMNLAVRVEGTRPLIPPGVDLSAFRIVQEALTNVLKHAGPATVTVAIRYYADSVTVEVEDDGRGASTAPADGHPGGGHGLIGMRERAAVFGGHLTAGSRVGGGFRVAARLPFGVSPSDTTATNGAGR
jgi:signal transduction histidine kinase